MSEQDISVLELFKDIALAKQRMNVSNPHRLIFAKCEAAIWQLSKELHDLKQSQTIGLSQVEEGTPV